MAKGISKPQHFFMLHLRLYAKVQTLEQQNRRILKKFDRDKKTRRVLTGICAIYRALQLTAGRGKTTKLLIPELY
jgi:hypothetical protein